MSIVFSITDQNGMEWLAADLGAAEAFAKNYACLANDHQDFADGILNNVCDFDLSSPADSVYVDSWGNCHQDERGDIFLCVMVQALLSDADDGAAAALDYAHALSVRET